VSNGATEVSWEGIAIVGSGINVPDQLTLEGLRMLRQASEIWTNVSESEHKVLEDAVGQAPHSLWPFFRPERERLANYEAITTHLLERAQAVERVAYLTQGHPRVLDRVATNVLEQSSRRGVTVTVVPGISSIDTILADVDYEPARGLQVYDATGFVARGMKIDRRAGLLLLQPGVFGTSMPRLNAAAPPPDLSTLKAALAEIYDVTHPVLIVRSETATMTKRIREVELGALDSVPAADLAASTLWIAPVDVVRR
jgi:uncharacterized protein YabN with tetrapyrrole methylase and pyrophosphatase domain